MTARGLVVLGAAGSLGSAFADNGTKRVQTSLLFDQAPNLDQGIFACDLACPKSIEAAFGSIDVRGADFWYLFVTSAHYAGSRETSLSWADLSASLAVNLVGIVMFVARFIDLLVANDLGGRIVLTSSAAAKVGSHDLGYGVAKAGVEGLVRSTSKVYAKQGITTIGLSPGIFRSKMSDAQHPDRRSEAVAATHTKRLTELDEILKCALFLVFEAPDAMSGTIVNASAGQVAT